MSSVQRLLIISRTSIQIRWYLPDLSDTLDGKKRHPTQGVGVSKSSGGSPLFAVLSIWIVGTTFQF